MPRAAPAGREIGVSRSFDPSTMGRGGLQRTQSNSPSMMIVRPAAPPNRGLARGRSMSPSRMARGRSNSPSQQRGRPAPPRRSVGPSRSFDTAVMTRGRSNSPSRRTLPRTRSMSPSRMAAAAAPRGRSRSPSRSMHPTAAAAAAGDKKRRGPRMPKGFKSFRRNKTEKKVPAYNDPNRRGGMEKRRLRSLEKIAPKESCDMKKCICYTIPIVLMLASIGGLVTVTGNAGKVVPDGIQNRIADLVPTFDKGNVEDPFSGTDVPKWNNNGESGLAVTVVDALDDSWQVAFSLAIADWDFGNPDALALTTEKVDHDVPCDPIDEKIKVCNGDYGAVPWRGINQAVVDDGGFITASAARMNDFYLPPDTDDDARQYTMCHEVGHAFGLPHTDEEFDNEDLGNCLDYTDNFDVNKHPSEMNYAYLIDLYGPSSLRRNLRHIAAHKNNPQRKTMPHHLRSKMSAAVEELLAHEDHPERHARIAAAGWKLLHHESHGEEHELELGEGYKVRLQLLLVPSKHR